MEPETSRGGAEVPGGLPTNRIEALADGVFAVAMTILVLELRVPSLGPDVADARLLSALQSLVPQVLSFASGFVILGTLWVGHHFQFNYSARTASRRLVAPSLPPEVFAGLRNRVLMGMVGYGGGLLLSFFAPRAGLLCYATTPLLYLLPGRFDRHVRADR